jgi:hypothetical protein
MKSRVVAASPLISLHSVATMTLAESVAKSRLGLGHGVKRENALPEQPGVA